MSIPYIYRKKLSTTLLKKCEGWIARSGDEAERVNCYTVYAKYKNDEKAYVVSLNEQNLKVRVLSNVDSDELDEKVISINEYGVQDFEIIHYEGVNEIRYQGLTKFYFGDLNIVRRFRNSYYRIKSEYKQLVFNRIKVITFERVELLKELLDINKKNIKIEDPAEFLVNKYGYLWMGHPRSDEIETETRFVFNMLCETEEIEIRGCEYYVTGKGLLSIGAYEEEERKHKEAMSLQRWIIFLTFVLAITGVLQNYKVIKEIFITVFLM